MEAIVNQRHRQYWQGKEWKKEGDKGKKMKITSTTLDEKKLVLLISLTSCQWPSPNCEYTHSGTFEIARLCLFRHYQTLWSMESGWNGSLIEHGFYFPLLFLNLQHNVLQMLSEEEVRMEATKKKKKNNLKGSSKWHGLSREIIEKVIQFKLEACGECAFKMLQLHFGRPK